MNSLSITREDMDKILSSGLRVFWTEPPSKGWDDVLDLWRRVLSGHTAKDIQGGMDRLVRRAQHYREITPAAVLGHITSERDSSLKRIAMVVAEESDMTLAELTGPNRKANLVRSRQLAMHIARKITGKSHPEIGFALGRRDHTTILHGCQRAEEFLETSEDYRGLHHRCMARLAGMVELH